jgi:hypothetical protein
MVRLVTVTAPYVILKCVDPMSGNWTMRGLYAGGVVDEADVEPESLKRHLGEHLVRLDDASAEPKAEAEPKNEKPAEVPAVEGPTPVKATAPKSKA